MKNHRFRPNWLSLIAYLGTALLSTAPAADDAVFSNQVGVLVEYYELDHAALPPLLREYQLAPDASTLVKKVQEMAAAGEARLVESSYLVTQSGQRAKITSAREFLYPTEYDPPELPQTLHGPLGGDLDIITPTNPTAYDYTNLGHILEVEPTTSADGSFVSLNFAAERVQLVGRTEWGKDESMTEMPIFHRMTSPTTIAIKFGGCELFGTFTPPDPRGKRLLGFVSAMNLAASEKEFVRKQDAAELAARQVSLITEFIEVDAALASQLARELANSADASAIRRRLDDRIAKGEAKLIETNVALTLAGARTKSESAHEYLYPTEYDPAEIPQAMTGPIDAALDFVTSVGATAFDSRNLGVGVEFEPKLVPGGSLIRLNIAPQRVLLVGQLVHGIEESTATQPLFESMSINTSVAVADGTTMLLGMHSLETARASDAAEEKDQAAVRGRRVLVFVTGKIKSLKE